MSRRRVAVITGTRAEYGLLKSTLAAIKAHPRLTLQLVVTGMHLLREFGHTVDDIVRDGWRIDARVRMQAGSDDPLDQAVGLARGVQGIARFLAAAKTDVVLVLGDRIEAMAGALAAVTTGRVLAHIHGGDVAPGDFDDSLRHAITKLAHVHLVATRDAARRVVRLGESAERVHVVGAPGLDRLRELLERSGRAPYRPSNADRPKTLLKSSGTQPRGDSCPPDPGVALVVYHARGRPAAVEASTMETLLRAVASLGLRRLILYPNTDRGHRGVLRAIERHRRRSPRQDVQVFPSLPRDDYLRALLGATVLVGNSSSGIIEAPLPGTPSVDVGPRQAGRQPGGPSVIHCGESELAIRQALHRALRICRKSSQRSVYGGGRSGPRIADLLARVPLDSELARKVITY
jgi:GDP/UDP-N,N'-diacetylbacillosamine 2-epimerase (hydrolysing)